MPRVTTEHDVIPFDRFWRAGHPMRPKTRGLRRWGMYVVLAVLCAVIGGYAYLTNSNRVREMAESYLSQLLGGRVEVRRATLSVFEGLRLDDVKVRLIDAPRDQPPIFTADTFVVRYSLRQLIAGRIEATQIIAKRPHVQLTQDLDSLMRSYRRVVQDSSSLRGPGSTRPLKPPPLPEISLRDARVDYREQRPDGTTSVGTIALEGQFLPAESFDRYNFSLQSRGMSDRMGPYVEGSIYPRVGRISAQLRNFELGADIRLMLPAPVRQWWERHELAGKVDVTELTYILPRGTTDARFTVRTALQGVTIVIPPGELMSSDESHRVASARGTIETMGAVFRAGAHTGLGPMAPFESLFSSAPLKLDNMAGAFVFTEEGIEVEGVRGDVEGNRVFIDGKIAGYPGRAGLPEPPGALRITSGGRPLTLPAAPAYVNALPRAVREIYEQLRPQGACTLAVNVARPTPGAKIGLDGAIEVLDASFTFLRFPYPVRHATGRMTLAPASDTAPERLELNLRGLGIAGGRNDKTVVSVVGVMGPLGNDSGVAMRIASDDVYSEDALTQAFPLDVQRTLKLFDAEGKGRFPTFHGRFTCDVNRAVGPLQPWLLYTHVNIDNATGSLAAFPYPLENLAMELKIGEDHVDVINAHVAKGDATLRVDGRVSWAPPEPPRAPGERRGKPPGVRPARPATVTELTVNARDLPIDRDLLAALPPEKRGWLTDVGLGGRLDITGSVRSHTRAQPAILANAVVPPADPAPPEVRYDLDATLRHGTIWPTRGSFVIAGASGRLKLKPDRVELVDLKGKRGAGTVAASGSVTFAPEGATADLTFAAENLLLDAPLYALLPTAGREAWDQVRPTGTLDADVTYVGRLGPKGPPGVGSTYRPAGPVHVSPPDRTSAMSGPSDEANRARPRSGSETIAPARVAAVDPVAARPATEPAPTAREVPVSPDATPAGFAPPTTTRPSPAGRHTVVLRPRQLSVFPKSFPYKLDGMTGRVVVDGGKTTLHHVTGRHGDGILSLWGNAQAVGEDDVWSVTLFARDVTADEDLFKAMPASVAESLRSMGLKGKVGWYVPRFVYTARQGSTDAARADIEITGKISLSGADMDVGVPLKGVDGAVSGRATVTGGKLTDVHGSLDFAKLTAADRPAANFRAELDRDAGSDALRLTKMQAELAGGDVAGDVTVVSPETGVGRYSVNLVVRDADAATIAMNGKTEIKGRLSASLGLEGNFDDPNSRRGRGDVLVNGRGMYNLPVVMGLLQITNLALPVATPFNQATARYSVEGQRVTFDSISLRSDTMIMQGDGHLDFATKKVALTLTTDNPNAIRIPFLSDLWRNAQQELFKIEVRGTIEDPKVSANPLNTVTTTVDEVFNADRKR